MSKAQDRRLATMGVHEEYLSHEHPERGIPDLWPSIIGTPIELTKIPTITSYEVQQQYEDRGTQLDSVPFDYYRDQTYNGQPRMLSNADFLKGKEPLYGTGPEALARADKIRRLLEAPVNKIKAEADPNTYLGRSEWEDIDKITAQQWRYPGYFLQSAITDADVPEFNDWHFAQIDRVASVYGRRLQELGLPKDFKSLVMLDDDPPDTMTGAPTFASGDRTHEARIAQLRAIPTPDCDPKEWVNLVAALGDKLGLPESIIWNPVLATRHGPFKKPAKLWYRTDGGFVCDYEAVSVYDRTRFVYPVPYYINFLLSPLYVQMSGVRKHTLGLWHDPEHQAQYIEQLRKQGGKPKTIDFSGMDTGMFKHVVMAFMRALRKHGFFQWSCDMFLTLYPQMGITFPSFFAEPHECTIMRGDATPWMSGFKLTSEMDTIYGMTVLLSCLSLQKPDIFDLWESGKWVFLELGDDIMFTAPFEIDGDRLAHDALALWGAKLKILDDIMFLKWLIPVVPEVPKLTRTFARFIQQTFYNEDRYDGVEGGTRPDSVMRMALYARMTSLPEHPHFASWWPVLWPALSELLFIQRASDEYKRRLQAGIPCLDAGDVDDIQAYAVRSPEYFLKLRARAKFEPSAANLLREAEALGLNLNLDPVAEQIRSIYVKSAWSSPTEQDVKVVAEYLQPFVNF